MSCVHTTCTNPEPTDEDVLAGSCNVVEKVLQAVPGTAEHAIAKQLNEEGDISVDTGEPLDEISSFLGWGS